MTAGLHDAWRWGVSLRQGVAGYFPPAFSAPKTLDILYYSLAPWDATTYGKEYLRCWSSTRSCTMVGAGGRSTHRGVGGFFPPSYVASAEPVQIQDAHTGKVLTVADPFEQGVKPYLAPWDGGKRQPWIHTADGSLKSVKHECVFEVDHSYGIAAVSLTSKARGAVCEIFDDGHIKCSDGRVLDVNRHKRRIQDDILVHRQFLYT